MTNLNLKPVEWYITYYYDLEFNIIFNKQEKYNIDQINEEFDGEIRTNCLAHYIIHPDFRNIEEIDGLLGDIDKIYDKFNEIHDIYDKMLKIYRKYSNGIVIQLEDKMKIDDYDKKLEVNHNYIISKWNNEFYKSLTQDYKIIEFLGENNNKERNLSLITDLKQKISTFRKKPIKANLKYYKPESLERYIYLALKQLDECKIMINKGYLMTFQLLELREIVRDLKKRDKKQEEKFSFKYTEDDILKIVKREANFKKFDRDVEIYHKRNEKIFLEDLSKEYNLSLGSISIRYNKILGKINYYKGKLFEKEYFKFLERKKIYDKVDLNGKSGEPDILAYKDDEIHIFSLKCLQAEKRPYYFSKEELEPEYETAYNFSFKYKKIYLYIVVFNIFNNDLIEMELDFKNPINIVIK